VGLRGRSPSTTRAAPALSATESTSGTVRQGVGHLDGRVHGVDRGEHGGDARARWDRLPDHQRQSGSARGWMSSATVIGCPEGTSMSAVMRPYTGSRMPRASRFALLVMPLEADDPPGSRRPGLRRVADGGGQERVLLAERRIGVRPRGGKQLLGHGVEWSRRTAEPHADGAQVGRTRR
jgi:hypothetical protein